MFRSGYLFLPEVPVSELLVHTVVEVEVQKWGGLGGGGETASSHGTQTSDFIYLPSCGHVLGSGFLLYY